MVIPNFDHNLRRGMELNQALQIAATEEVVCFLTNLGGNMVLGYVDDVLTGQKRVVMVDETETKVGYPSESLVNIPQRPNQIHHFASNKNKRYTAQFNQITRKYGLTLDEDWNKALMPHQGRHPNAYHDYILDNMQRFDMVSQGDKEIFLDLFEQMKNRIIENPEMLYKEYWRK